MMEKPSRIRSKILASLTKAAAAITFQISSPVSPAKAFANRKGYPSPVISIIPREAQRREKNLSFHQREPGSPKVSCIGQVKDGKNKKNNNNKHKPVLHPEEDTTPPSSAQEVKKKKKKKKMMMMMKKPILKMGSFKRGKEGDRVDVRRVHMESVVEKAPSSSTMRKYRGNSGSVQERVGRGTSVGRVEEQVEKKTIISCSARMEVFKGEKEKQGDKVDIDDGYEARVVERVPVPGAVPSLNQMNKYTSSRGGVLDKFDWRMSEGRGQERVENVILPCSAKVIVAGGELEGTLDESKQVNVWKRRNRPPSNVQT